MSEQIEKEIAEIEKQLDNPPLFDLSNVSREELEAFIQSSAALGQSLAKEVSSFLLCFIKAGYFSRWDG